MSWSFTTSVLNLVPSDYGFGVRTGGLGLRTSTAFMTFTGPYNGTFEFRVEVNKGLLFRKFRLHDPVS